MGNPENIITLEAGTEVCLGPSPDSDFFILKKQVLAEVPSSKNGPDGWLKLTVPGNVHDKLAPPNPPITVYLAIPEPQPTA